MPLKVLLLALAAMLALPVAMAEEPYGIFIQSASLSRRNDTSSISADVSYRFKPAMLEALENGVPLTLLVQFAIRRERPFWFAETIAEEERRIELRYHPLAKSYQIADQVSGAVQNFAGLAAMLETLSRLRGWQIGADYRLEPRQRYRACLQLRLDVESLPLPLRVVAYLAPNWQLDSPPFEWPLEP